MTNEEKAIRAREASTAYVRSTEHKDRTALIVLLDAERAKTAAMLAALKMIANQCGPFATVRPALDYATIGNIARDAVLNAEGR